MKNQTKFVWKCELCRKRNIRHWRYLFDMNKTGWYSVEDTCDGCGKDSLVEFSFRVTPVTKRKANKP